MPALQPYIIEPIWEQFEALLPEREIDPSARLPPAPHSRSSGFREARCGSRLRLRLLEDRRGGVFGDHDQAQGVTNGWRPV